jgi:hypothetical protein
MKTLLFFVGERNDQERARGTCSGGSETMETGSTLSAATATSSREGGVSGVATSRIDGGRMGVRAGVESPDGQLENERVRVALEGQHAAPLRTAWPHRAAHRIASQSALAKPRASADGSNAAARRRAEPSLRTIRFYAPTLPASVSYPLL